uniref:DENN domain-containing protein 4C-like isoform X2 n=1 Tax=Dermatophagoides pteronyssinus TaxID=6956 RepID=A0A6P6YEB5_DERPT|nr:DENN domain-containing protein 4C-like isoform X2 [Dermatophagoides pteronyssinus]
MSENRISDYFVVTGVDETDRHYESVYQPTLDPITDITVINRSNHEPVPQGYYCIEKTPYDHEANLNHGSINGSKFFICYKRSRDKPPLLDIGVLHPECETMSPECKMIKRTPSGFPANLNERVGTTKVYLTYRRSKKKTHYNQLVVSDICVILTSKNESPPHAFCMIEKNLNKGYLALRSDAYLCYKKCMDRPPHLLYNPIIIDRFPNEENLQYPLPQNLPLFCLPMGASIECWPKNDSIGLSLSTFILTTSVCTKIYGTLLNYYEQIEPNFLTDDELIQLKFVDDPKDEEKIAEALNEKSLQRIKSLCILSQWPFFDQFKCFLNFIYQNFICKSSTVPLEFYVFHFMKNIPFPTPDRPNIMVNLSASNDDLLFSHNFDDFPIPSNGASFKKLLQNLGSDNCLYLLLFMLTEQKILIHSLRLSILTEIAEALVSMIFPFNWNCPYIPLCPLSLAGVLNAPLPFIVGIYSQYFDYFEPPSDVISISLDTRAIHISDTKRMLNLDLLPKKYMKFLKEKLEEISAKIDQSVKSKERDVHMKRKFDKQIEIEIQEAFLYFMASIMKDFQRHLKPITAAPKVGATDPTTLFYFEGFIQAHPENIGFYSQLTKTQMFTKFIEERSLVSDKDISLAFFDDCIEKVEKYESMNLKRISKLNLINFKDIGKSSKTVFISLPFLINETFHQEPKFFDGRFKKDLFQKFATKFPGNETFPDINPIMNSVVDCTDSSAMTEAKFDSELQCYMFARRAKHEILKAQRIAQQSSQSASEWAKCLLINAYSLWFIHFPAFSYTLIQMQNLSEKSDQKSIKPLSIAYQALKRMQTMDFSVPDEFCYRILMILCCIHNRPALAVKIFLDMDKYNVKLNAITYGYYNKAVLDGNWPTDNGDFSHRKSRWIKLYNVIRVAMHFKIKYINTNIANESSNSLIGNLNENILRKKTKKSLLSKKNEQTVMIVDHCPSAGFLFISDRIDLSTTKSNLALHQKKYKSDVDINIIQKDFISIFDNLKTIKNDHILIEPEINPKESIPEISAKAGSENFNISEGNIFSNSFVTPLKETLVNMDFSKSPVADKLRSSYRIAKNFTKSRYNSKSNNNVLQTPPRIPRSLTLPQTFHTSTPANEMMSMKSQFQNYGMSSPSEYFYSTVKSIGGRINEFKLSLGTSSINSPVKFNMMNAVASRLSLKNDDENLNLSIDNLLDQFDENSFNMERYQHLLNEYYTNPLELFQTEETLSSSSTIGQIIWTVEMISCTICRGCQSIIYDEEIMSQWLPDDSNLNTRCIHCKTTFVPSLTVYIKDYRCTNNQQSSNGRLLDPISVPYLSPLVLRKELENILNGESYSSLILPKFVDNHPIVYWNLVWYFTRLNLPSHIYELALYATSLNSAEIIKISKQYGYSFKDVRVTCMWDNEKFYENIPLHQQWLKMKNAESETLSPELLDFKNLCQQLIQLIKERDLFKPIQFLISERNKLKKIPGMDLKNLNSLYRELMFLNLIQVPPALSVDLFDEEYRSAFESLTNKDKESLICIDYPLPNGAIFCRNLFKPLSLIRPPPPI